MRPLTPSSDGPAHGTPQQRARSTVCTASRRHHATLPPAAQATPARAGRETPRRPGLCCESLGSAGRERRECRLLEGGSVVPLRLASCPFGWPRHTKGRHDFLYTRSTLGVFFHIIALRKTYQYFEAYLSSIVRTDQDLTCHLWTLGGVQGSAVISSGRTHTRTHQYPPDEHGGFL